MNPMDLMKNLKDIQSKATEVKENLKNITAIGSAGGGMVVIEINGTFEILRVNIEKEVVDPTDIRMLEDLVLAAFSQAVLEIKSKIEAESAGMLPNILSGV